MQIMDDIIKTYKAADFERRTFLFLEHRTLREMFTEIDASDYFFENKLQGKEKTTAGRSKARWAAVLKWLPG